MNERMTPGSAPSGRRSEALEEEGHWWTSGARGVPGEKTTCRSTRRGLPPGWSHPGPRASHGQGDRSETTTSAASELKALRAGQQPGGTGDHSLLPDRRALLSQLVPLTYLLGFDNVRNYDGPGRMGERGAVAGRKTVEKAVRRYGGRR